MPPLVFYAGSCDENERIDRFLAVKQTDFTRSALEKLFNSGKISVNGVAVLKNFRLKSGDKIELIADEKEAETAVKVCDLPLNILHEDELLLVIDKPKGILVHPSEKGEEDTLAGALLRHCGGRLSTLGGALRPGIVHRIDKDTSGLLAAAKTNAAHEALARQFEAHSALRRYTGVVEGLVKEDSAVVDALIARHPVHRTRYCVPKNPKNARKAVTRYRVLARYDGFSHVEFELETGRTHQIRVHMAHLGHPLAGDTLYGAKPVKSFSGQCLHAGVLGFEHPASGERLEFFSPPPRYYADFLSCISI